MSAEQGQADGHGIHVNGGLSAPDGERELAPNQFYPSARREGVERYESKPQEPQIENKPLPAGAGPPERTHSDSELSEIAEEDARSDFNADESADSDDSYGR